MTETARFERLVKRAFAFYDYLRDIGDFCPIFPDHVVIGPTNGCNLRCIHCHQSSRGTRFTKKIGVMKLSLFEKIVDDVARHAARITLNSMGEPLLHPEIVDMVAYAKRKGVHTSILTNGTRLTEEMSERLLALKLDRIAFSHEGSNKEIHEAVRRRSDHDLTLKNILYFIIRNHELGRPVNVSMSMVVHSRTRKDVEPYQRFFGSFPIDGIYARELVNLAGGSPLAHEIDMSRHDPKKRPACSLPWTGLSVNWDGTVGACSLDFNESHIIGDANVDDLMTIFNSPEMRAFRRCHLDNEMDWIEEQGPLCRGCNQPFDEPECDIRRTRDKLPVFVARLAKVLGHEAGAEPQKCANAVREYEKLTGRDWTSARPASRT